MNTKTKAVVAAGLIASALLGAGLQDVLEQPEVKYEQVNVTMTETITELVEVEVPVNVTEFVEVDNGNLDLVLEELFDNDGSVEYLVEDLDDDELDQIVGRIIFANDVKALAVAEAKSEIVDLLHKENINGTVLDEDDIERVKVQDDDDEVVIADIDYEDLDAEVLVEIKFRQDDVDYLAVVEVEIQLGEVYDIDLKSISLR